SVDLREDRSPARPEGERDDGTSHPSRHGLRVVSARADPGGRATAAAGAAAAGGGRSRSRSRDRIRLRYGRTDAWTSASRRRRVTLRVTRKNVGPVLSDRPFCLVHRPTQTSSIGSHGPSRIETLPKHCSIPPYTPHPHERANSITLMVG